MKMSESEMGDENDSGPSELIDNDLLITLELS
jgi:hypothetical protein